MTTPEIRALTLLMASILAVIGSGFGSASQAEGPWTETRFQTGCDPSRWAPDLNPTTTRATR